MSSRFENPSVFENGKQAGAVNKWEAEMCEHNGKAAAIFHYLYLVDKGHRDQGRDAVMRFTEKQIVNQVFMGMPPIIALSKPWLMVSQEVSGNSTQA